MSKLVSLFLLGLCMSAMAQAWLDPANFPATLACDTTGGMVQKYVQTYRANPTPVYSIRTTPQDPATGGSPSNPAKYFTPEIDGVLEDNIWRTAETLLVNSWEDAGRVSACKDNRNFEGAKDLHAIWRFCYNHDGMYISCEVHDDIWDVDSLTGWYLQDGVEISVDPSDWGDYAAGLWNDGAPPANDKFRRYWNNNSQIVTYPDGSHESFFHILKRAVDEQVVTGLVKGVHKNNYAQGQERTNFVLGDASLHGIKFATKRHGVDNWGRSIVHHEFMFPYHGTLWSSLPGSYFDGSTELTNGKKLPAEGKLFKVDMFNNEDDISGPNGANPKNHQMGRRRGDEFSPRDPNGTHWSDVRYFQAFKYAGNQPKIIAPVTVGGTPHGFKKLIGNWVNAVSDTIRYDFTDPGTIKIGNTIYYYDDTTTANGLTYGKLTNVQTNAVAGTFVYKNNVNEFLDELTVTISGQSPLSLIRAFTTGYSELSNTRWVKATMEIATACQNGYADTVLSPIPGSAGGIELRFIALSQLVDSLMPSHYRNCTDSVRFYITGTDSVTDIMTYMAKPRQLVRDRNSGAYAYWEIKKPFKAADINAPVAMILTYHPSGKKDTLLKVQPLNYLTFGETKTTYVGEVATSTNADPIKLYPIDKLNIAWRIAVEKYKGVISINDGDSGKTKGVVPVSGAAFQSLQTYPATWNGSMLDGAILSTSLTDSNNILGKRLFSCELKADTLILEGYNPANPAAIVTPKVKPAGTFIPNDAWIEQTVTFILKKGAVSDSYVFKDTTQVKQWLFINGSYYSTGTSLYNLIDTNKNNLCPKIFAENPIANAVDKFEVSAYPNPFNPVTILRVSVPASMEGKEVALHVYNIRGQLVRTLLKSSVTRAGFKKRVVWEGENNSGNKVSSGMYYYRLTAGNKVLKGSIVMTK